jgi:hypothetical protein
VELTAAARHLRAALATVLVPAHALKQALFHGLLMRLDVGLIWGRGPPSRRHRRAWTAPPVCSAMLSIFHPLVLLILGGMGFTLDPAALVSLSGCGSVRPGPPA